MVQPEDWIEAGVWDVAHVSSASNEAVDRVVHVLEGVVGSASAVGVCGVGERGVVGLVGNQLIRRVVDGLSVGLELQVGETWLTLSAGTRIAHRGVVFRDDTVTGWEIGS